MKLSTLLLLPALLTSFATADTIRMRDGSRIEGEVISEKDDHYVVRVQVTKTIRDQRKILKKDVLEIIAEQKDEIAFEALEDLLPTPDLMTTRDYDALIEKVEAFVADHPKSRFRDEASDMLETLDDERRVIAAGGIKFENKLIGAGDRDSKAYPLDARIAASKVTQAGDANAITAALRAWTEFEKDFATSAAYRDTVPYVLKLMRRHQRAIVSSLETLDERIAEREDGLAGLPDRDRDRSRAAIAQQRRDYLKKIAAEKKANEPWLSLDPHHKEPLTDTERKLKQAISQLERFEASKVPDGDAAWNEAWKIVTSSPDEQTARQAIANARSARLPDRYLKMLEAKVSKK